MKPLVPELNQPKSKLESATTLIKRFSAGAAIGLIIAAIQWGSYIYFFDSIPLTKGIIFCLGLTIICGLMTLKWGYKILESLLQLLG
ncbi:hypothetical protein VB735_27110 [Halotia wernerae UHCC 0503]|nr:hypothetical protein [Halotia wernerae UHCC 0503]